MRQPILPILLILVLVASSPAFAQLPIPEDPLWEPIVDEVYLQEVSTLIPGPALNAVAVYAGNAYVGGADGVSVVAGETLQKQSGPSGGVTRLKVLGDALWAVSSDGLWTFDGASWAQATATPVTDVCLLNGTVIAASGNGLYAVGDGGLTVIAEGRVPLLGAVTYSGTVYVHDGKEVGLLEKGKLEFENITDWGMLERGSTIRDMMSYGSRLYLATDEGVGLLRGMTWYNITGDDGLCYEDTTCLARGFDRDLWIGTMRGAIRNVDDEYLFYGYERWIPNDKVNAIATGDHVSYIATDGGLGIITYEPYTLAKKAAYYERWLDEWGMRRLGFIHILFEENGEWIREVSDNDVGYTSHYVTAKCFEYAVTGDPKAREAALDGFKSMKWSEEITSIDGFPARSIYAVGERTHKAMHGSGGLPAEWHATPDGLWEWKGDTSSDETDAHVYETTIFLSLVANEKEKVWATDHLHRVVGHIVDNGFFLRDVDGKPTRWARWDPDYLQTPYGFYARGLNGMEAFNYVTAALHFTGDEKFAKAKQFHLEQGYLPDIIRQKLTFHPGYWTHFDDRLAFYSYYPLVQYETDPDLKAIWLRSLERSWEVKRSQSVPWFNFIYGAVTGNDCEADKAVDHLRGWPLDLRRHSYTNSHRDDLYMPPGYTEYGRRPKPLNPRETEPNRWDGDFMRLDGVYGGKMVSDPSGWLDAYWMGRYYGLITAPQTKDKDLITVPKRGLQLGAAPYSGPERPKLEHER
ncbi:MAG: hypothetical protein AMXMBFR84_26860 [Candidatus Hydrogenedentota bacterium]